MTALQRLPARQRAVLILREVLRWKADEVADLLETTVASVNSALQRARATLSEIEPAESDPFLPMDDEQQALLSRYVDAFERYDLDSLVTLLHDDVVQSMPPYDLWLRGHADIRGWFLGTGIGCRGSVVIPVEPANGLPAFGQYKPGPDGGYVPWAIQVLEISQGQDRRAQFLPRHHTGCSLSSGCPWSTTGRTPSRPQRRSNSRSPGEAFAELDRISLVGEGEPKAAQCLHRGQIGRSDSAHVTNQGRPSRIGFCIQCD